MRTYVFDVDGVLIDSEERFRAARELTAHWRTSLKKVLYYEALIALDKPRPCGVKLYLERAKQGRVVVVSGRPKEILETTLNEVIKVTGIKPALILLRPPNVKSVMKWKMKVMTNLIRKGFNVVEVHDDDKYYLREVKKRMPEVTAYLHLPGGGFKIL